MMWRRNLVREAACLCVLTPLLAAPRLAAAEGAVKYDKGFVIEDGDAFELKIGARVQTRYQWESMDVEPERDNTQAFSIPRARIKLDGKVFDPRLTFKYQADFGKGFVTLKDFIINFRAMPGFELQAGQFKRPYSRHQLTSSGDLAMVDRAITDKVLPTGRDIGFMVGSGRHGQTVEWELGLFNGTGEVPKLNAAKGTYSNVPADFVPALVMRLGYNYGKMKGYSEADLEGGPLRFAVAANSHANLNATSDADPTVVVGADAALKVQGLAVLTEVHRDQDAETTLFMAQAGYLIAEHYEPGARFALIMPDADGGRRQEISLGFSAYFFGHGAKWQTDFALLETEDAAGDTTTDRLLRSQVQLAF